VYAWSVPVRSPDVSVRERLRAWTAWLGLVAACGMFLVLVMGATVTTTGSAQGCGRDWPLCNGRFIPEFAVATFIEFSHRAVTGVEGVLILTLTVAVLTLYGRQRPVRVLAPLMLGTLILQALLGAWAVKYPQQPAVLAVHFGVSLVALASTAMTAAYVWRPRAMTAAPAVGGGVRLATWGAAVYLYFLVYSGAFIRHAGDAYACPGWPLCGRVSGAPAAALAVNLVHRLAAGAALAMALGLIYAYTHLRERRPDLVAGGWLLLATLIGQAGSGAFLVLSRWSLFGELAHAAVTGLTFTAAAYLCLRVTLGRRLQPAPAPTAPALSPERARP
jgi:cytochrome c oxidase assembly protein subunit 15